MWIIQAEWLSDWLALSTLQYILCHTNTLHRKLQQSHYSNGLIVKEPYHTITMNTAFLWDCDILHMPVWGYASFLSIFMHLYLCVNVSIYVCYYPSSEPPSPPDISFTVHRDHCLTARSVYFHPSLWIIPELQLCSPLRWCETLRSPLTNISNEVILSFTDELRELVCLCGKLINLSFCLACLPACLCVVVRQSKINFATIAAGQWRQH